MILDTNVWSVLSKPKREARPLAWIYENELDLWLSPLVVAEVRFGLERPEAAHKKATLSEWLAGLEEDYRERTLPFDNPAGHALGRLMLAKPQEAKLLDTLLAAQALSRDCPIATRNTRDFLWTGAKLIDPWQA